MSIRSEIFKAEAIVNALPRVIKSDLIGSAMFSEQAKDVDMLVLISRETDPSDYFGYLAETGWLKDYDYELMSSNFYSFRKDMINIIITQSPEFYTRFYRAMLVCKYLKVPTRLERSVVCDIVINGRNPSEASMEYLAKNNYARS